MLQQSDKYLYFSYQYDGSLDSKTRDLVLLMRVALSLRRIPIIKEAGTFLLINIKNKPMPLYPRLN